MPTEKQYFPLDGYTKSFWLGLEDQEEFSSHRTTRELPSEVDVLVIGSGYAGASTAHYLLHQDPALRVALYEARTACSGATGRNGGHVKPYYHRNYDLYLQMLGEKGAAEVVNSEYDHLWAIKKIVDDNNIDCDFFLTRACDVYPDKEDSRVARDLEAAKSMLANPHIYPEMKKQFQIFHGAAARMISKSPQTDIAFTYPAASCWPWKLFISILKMCVAKGLNLQTNTLVTKVTSTDNGKWVVHTPRGTTICGKVVYCTNGYTKGLLEEFSNTIVPQRGVCCSIEAADKDHTPHLTNTYGLFTSRPNSDYLINRPDGTIIVGGRDESLIKPNGDISGWFDCVDDTYVDEVSKAEFKDYMKKRFSTWENTDSDVSKIWSGILGFTNDYLPYVGELDVIGKKGCYIVAGFHGHGMPRVLFSAKAVATCITQNKKVHELEYTIPKGFFVSKERIEKPNVYEQGIHKFVKEHYDAKL